jgi:hypothetical protein
MTTNVSTWPEPVPTAARCATDRDPDAARVVAVLPRGEAIRNFVHTGALAEVARRARVSLLTVLPSDRIHRALADQFDDVHELWPSRLPRTVGYLRELLDLSHGRWLWSEAARERWRVRDAEADGLPQVSKRVAKKTVASMFANRLGLDVLSRAESAASLASGAVADYRKLLARLQPSLVFNGSHVHCAEAVQAVYAARSLRIPTAAFIFSWDNLTSQGRIIPFYDYYFVWNEELAEQLLRIYDRVRPEQVFVTGTPQFDFHFRPEYAWSREEFCARVGADPSRPIALYSTGMANHMPGEPLVVEGIADMLARMEDLGRPQLLVRVYAKDQTGRFDDLKARRPDILFPPALWEPAWYTPTLEDAYLYSNMLRHSALGINVASTVSLELCMFDKPVVNVAYRPSGRVRHPAETDWALYYTYDHYRPVVESGAVAVARSEAEMAPMLRRALMVPGEASEARRALVRKMFGDRLDGYSALRLAERLVDLGERGARLERRRGRA